MRTQLTVDKLVDIPLNSLRTDCVELPFAPVRRISSTFPHSVFLPLSNTLSNSPKLLKNWDNKRLSTDLPSNQ